MIPLITVVRRSTQMYRRLMGSIIHDPRRRVLFLTTVAVLLVAALSLFAFGVGCDVEGCRRPGFDGDAFLPVVLHPCTPAHLEASRGHAFDDLEQKLEEEQTGVPIPPVLSEAAAGPAGTPVLQDKRSLAAYVEEVHARYFATAPRQCCCRTLPISRTHRSR